MIDDDFKIRNFRSNLGNILDCAERTFKEKVDNFVIIISLYKLLVLKDLMLECASQM